MGEEEKKEEDWLQQLCGDDAKLYDVLAISLYLDPTAAIPKEDLRILIEAAEKSVKDENYEEAIGKYRWALDKAIFEATQHQEEKDRYIKIIQDLLSKSTQATEKVKEKAEKEGRTDRFASIGRGTEYCKFVSDRIEDILEIARHFYDDRLKTQGEKERGKKRLEEKREKRRKDETEEKREEKRNKTKEKKRRDEKIEEDREDQRIEEREKETGEARRKKILETRK